jgi:flagella basal body P-ring formation protein FlgA
MISLLFIQVSLATPLDSVVESLVDYTKESCSVERVEVERLGLLESLVSHDEIVTHWSGDPCQSRPTLRLVASEHGNHLGAWTLRPSLNIWMNVPVVLNDVSSGDLIEVSTGLVEISDIRGPLITEGNLRARVSLQAGDPVTARVATPMPDVARGSAVSIQSRSTQLVVSMSGNILVDGFVGDRVRVRSQATSRSLSGLLVDNHTVVVD